MPFPIWLYTLLPAGLNILRGFLEPDTAEAAAAAAAANQRTLDALTSPDGAGLGGMGLARRVIACLDVRSNDAGARWLNLYMHVLVTYTGGVAVASVASSHSASGTTHYTTAAS